MSRVIDADAHVIETEHTWDYLGPFERKYRPLLAASYAPGDEGGQSVGRDYWVIDGKIRGFRFPTLSERELAERSQLVGRNLETPQEAREMDNVALRLQHMDALGIDIQVLHNTLFIEQVTDRPSAEIAICGAWNRWMADIWQQATGRLRWSCVLPLLSTADAIDQMRFAQQHGAVAVCMRPLEGNRLVVDPSFYPIFAEAERLNLAIAVHIANGNPLVCDALRSPEDPGFGFALFRAPTVIACHSLLLSPIPDLFPQLRWGFIETAAQWVPWVLREAASRARALPGKELPPDVLKKKRIYVTCQNDDDLPYIIGQMGDDNLVIGTDYGHTDPSSDVDAIKAFRSSGLSARTIEKILDDNPSALYGL